MKKLVILLLLIPVLSMAQKTIVKSKVKFLALGDSYTIGQSVPVKDRWPVQLIDALAEKGLDCFDAKIIATTGWRTDNLKSAIQSSKPSNDYSLVSLLIGVNNYFQGRTVESYKPEFEELLQMAIALAGGDKSKVFVVSIPDYGFTPFGQSNQPKISSGIDEFNAASKAITLKLGVNYITITDISRRGLSDPSLVAGDGLHPSGKMYAEWVTRILQSFTIDLSPPSTIDPDDNDQGSVPIPPTPTPIDDIVTGIQQEQFGIRVYPNPFNTTLVFENLPRANNKIQIYNSTGQHVITQNSIHESKTMIETSKLDPGIYQYHILSQNGSLVCGKILKSY